jgi:hypothetical protein
MKVRATTDVRIRYQPNQGNDTFIAGVIPAGAIVEAQPAPDAPGWYRFPFQFQVALKPSVKNPYSLWTYASASLFAPVTVTPPDPQPPPQARGKCDIGVSVLNAHHLLEPAYQLGIRSFLIMNGIQKAREFKLAHPDAYVMARRHMPGIGDDYLPELNSGEMRELQTIGHGITVVSPVNEGDIWPQGPKPGKTAREVIQKRAEFDYRMALEVRKNGGFYAGGSFSMGEPDYTSPEICDAMRDFYAPHYNSGLMGINYHSYSPNPQNVDATDGRQLWHEDRWRFLFEKCGFLNVDNPVGIVCDETGLDQGGIGGVPAHGLNGSFVEYWTRKTKARWASIVIQGKPAPIRHATWFQAGDNRTSGGGWAGFNVEWYLADIVRGNA